jgi:hypothetical protein
MNNKNIYNFILTMTVPLYLYKCVLYLNYDAKVVPDIMPQNIKHLLKSRLKNDNNNMKVLVFVTLLTNRMGDMSKICGSLSSGNVKVGLLVYNDIGTYR